MKLNRAICVLSKLRHNAYQLLFSSQLIYVSQVWGQKSIKAQTTFQTLLVFPLKKNSQLFSSLKPFYCGYPQNYSDIPYSQTYTYGTKSVMNNCIKDWNSLKKFFPNLFQDKLNYPRIKSVRKDHLLNQY